MMTSSHRAISSAEVKRRRCPMFQNVSFVWRKIAALAFCSCRKARKIRRGCPEKTPKIFPLNVVDG